MYSVNLIILKSIDFHLKLNNSWFNFQCVNFIWKINVLQNMKVIKLFLCSKHSMFLHAVISRYCSAIGRTLANANSPSPVRTIYGITNFTCNYGYYSSGGTIRPFYTCKSWHATAGQWSVVNYSCQSMYVFI